MTDPPGSVATVAFVDLAGFTAMTEAHGDDHAAELARRLVALASDALEGEDRLVKSMGDAVMLVSTTPEAGLALVERLLSALLAEPNFPVPRAGLHAGPATERDGDYYGATVNLAARVAAQAHGGQVLGTRPLAEAARAAGTGVVSLGSFALRNVAEPVELFEIHLCPEPEGGAIDPVCRMQVRREDAAGRLRHGGLDHWFCSLECVAAFAQAPERYADPTG